MFYKDFNSMIFRGKEIGTNFLGPEKMSKLHFHRN
jgi:hypothetical protein